MTKILLVDDMKNFLDLEISFLRRAECQIFTAGNGLEAVKIAKKEKPDIILLDLVMPQMDGIQATRILKSDPDTRDIPVVIVTSTDRKEECLKAGANDFVQKPINEQILLKEIKKFVDIKERQDERVQASIEVKINKGGKEIPAITRDISMVGAFIVTDEKIPLGSVIPIKFLLKDKEIQVNAEVVREEREDVGAARVGGIGVKFVEISDADKETLRAYLEELKKR